MSTTTGAENGERYAFDHQAGPVYGYTPISNVDAEQLVTQREVPHIISFVVWPYPEAEDQRPTRRNYYALNLPQAVARATEIEIRLREQQVRAVLARIRPATPVETNTYFGVMDIAEARIGEPIDARELLKDHSPMIRILSCGRRSSDLQDGERT